MYEHAVISASGALINFSGKKTGRSPKDKRIVYEDSSKDDIWVCPLILQWLVIDVLLPGANFPHCLLFECSGDLSTSRWTSTLSKSTESVPLITSTPVRTSSESISFSSAPPSGLKLRLLFAPHSVFDGFAGWDPKYRIKVRVICARAYHALFVSLIINSSRAVPLFCRHRCSVR